MTYTHDIIIIGAGSGGLNIAGFMNRIGMNVALIEKSDAHIGGDCLNFGCVPSKALIHVAKTVKQGRQAQKFSVATSPKNTTSIDMKLVKKYIHDKKEVIRKHENAQHFKDKGMDVILGTATFHDKHSVQVNNKIYSAKHIILATGSRAKKLQIPGIQQVKYLTNETIFDIEKLPKELLVIGGGPIGIELGQAFAYLGSKVTIVQRGNQFLPKEDPQVAEILQKQLIKDGINIITQAETIQFPTKNSLEIQVKNKKQILKFDEVLISIGREVNIEGLELEKADIHIENKKLKLNPYLQTTNKSIYAVGDVAGQYQFTHAAEVHAGVVIQNMFSPIKKKISYDTFAWVTYTTPQIATFGLQEQELQKRNIAYQTISQNVKNDDRAIVDDISEGLLKLHVTKNGKIIGGTMIGEQAGELVQELILANTLNIPIDDIFKKVYPYPTATRINKSAIAQYMAKKLNEKSKKILRLLYKII